MKKVIIFLAIILNLSSHAYERIISLGGTLTEIIFALGEGKHIVATDLTSIYPIQANEIKKLGYRQNISLEGIVSLKPDLIIASSKMVSKELISKMNKLNLNVHLIKEDESFESAKHKIVKISNLLNKAKLGVSLVSKLEEDLRKVGEKSNALKNKKAIFIYARGGNSIYLAGRQTAAHKMIEASGLINGFSSSSGFKPISSEALALSNPDYVILLKSGAKSLGKSPWEIKGMKYTKAAKGKKLFLVDDLAFLGFGPRSGDVLINLIDDISEL